MSMTNGKMQKAGSNMNEKQEVENIIKAKLKEATELIESLGLRFPESIAVETSSTQKLSEAQPRRIISRVEVVQ